MGPNGSHRNAYRSHFSPPLSKRMGARKASQTGGSSAEATHCSPARYNNKGSTLNATGTCLTSDEVAEAAHAMLGTSVSGRFDARSLVERVHKAMGTSHGEEDQWVNAPQIAQRTQLKKKIETAFRPSHPDEWLSDPHYWLSNFDIDAVMRQYQEASPTFKFIGVFPRDFSARTGTLSGGTPKHPTKTASRKKKVGGAFEPSQKGKEIKGSCVSNALCNLSLAEEISKGYKEVGFVLNLDTHRGPGTHWTACYIGLDPVNRPHRFGFFYYDSVGRQPPKEIREFSSKLSAEAKTVFPDSVPFRVAHNTVRKQFQDSECGIYSMFFIVAVVQTEIPFEQICRDVIKRDGAMHSLRRVFFRPPT